MCRGALTTSSESTDDLGVDSSCITAVTMCCALGVVVDSLSTWRCLISMETPQVGVLTLSFYRWKDQGSEVVQGHSGSS